MPKKDDLTTEHISWLVHGRSRNQEISLKLFLIMKYNDEVIKSQFHLSDIAQSLAGACFSLWRAVFLSDVSETSQIVVAVDDATAFLGGLILHNMVAYPQDRNARDWSFLYYVNNARYRLESISKGNKQILPHKFVSETVGFESPKDCWSYYQDALDVAVRNFEKALCFETEMHREFSN
jgi:hypothetical protein